MWGFFKKSEAYLKHAKRNRGFSSNVRYFERFLGFLKTFSEKWRLQQEI
jgi:hypothetical protein